MYKGHHACYMDKIEDVLKTPDDSDIGFLLEVDLNYPDGKKLPLCS